MSSVDNMDKKRKDVPSQIGGHQFLESDNVIRIERLIMQRT